MPPSKAVLTLAEAGDVDSLAEIRLEAMRASLEKVGRFDPVRARERFTRTFDPHRTRHIEVDGERVGFIVTSQSGETMLLEHFYIRPSSQRSGIGAAVLQLIFEEADAAGLPIKVGALKGSDSNRFYMRHSFKFSASSEFDNYYIRMPIHDCSGPAGKGRLAT